MVSCNLLALAAASLAAWGVNGSPCQMEPRPPKSVSAGADAAHDSPSTVFRLPVPGKDDSPSHHSGAEAQDEEEHHHGDHHHHHLGHGWHKVGSSPELKTVTITVTDSNGQPVTITTTIFEAATTEYATVKPTSAVSTIKPFVNSTSSVVPTSVAAISTLSTRVKTSTVTASTTTSVAPTSTAQITSVVTTSSTSTTTLSSTSTPQITTLMSTSTTATSTTTTSSTTTTPSICVETNLISNPSFENSTFAPWSNMNGQISGYDGLVFAEDGSNYFLAQLNNSQTFIAVYQTMTNLVPNEPYRLRFYYGVGARQDMNPVGSCSLYRSWAGIATGAPIDLTFGPPGFWSYYEEMHTPASDVEDLGFLFVCNAMTELVGLLDNVSLVRESDTCMPPP